MYNFIIYLKFFQAYFQKKEGCQGKNVGKYNSIESSNESLKHFQNIVYYELENTFFQKSWCNGFKYKPDIKDIKEKAVTFKNFENESFGKLYALPCLSTRTNKKIKYTDESSFKSIYASWVIACKLNKVNFTFNNDIYESNKFRMLYILTKVIYSLVDLKSFKDSGISLFTLFTKTILAASPSVTNDEFIESIRINMCKWVYRSESGYLTLGTNPSGERHKKTISDIKNDRYAKLFDEVYKMSKSGMSLRQIASVLNISKDTVNRVMKNKYKQNTSKQNTSKQNTSKQNTSKQNTSKQDPNMTKCHSSIHNTQNVIITRGGLRHISVEDEEKYNKYCNKLMTSKQNTSKQNTSKHEPMKWIDSLDEFSNVNFMKNIKFSNKSVNTVNTVDTVDTVDTLGGSLFKY